MEKVTLKEYLTSIGVNAGNDFGFVLQEDLFSRNEMNVSRRYLEGAAWKHLLDKRVLTVINPFIDIFGRETIKIILSM